MEAMDTSGEKIQIKDGPALSPTSSSSPSQSSADRNFEPTIDMMVNDFDDDETLQEEEAIAALEYQNPQDEIDRLREESEMPIEELLARYGSMPAAPPPPVVYNAKKKSRKTANASNKRAKIAPVQVQQEAKSPIQVDGDADADGVSESVRGDVIVIESGDEEVDELTISKDKQVEDDTCKHSESVNDQECDEVSSSTEIPKKRRTHLMDLYPEENFNAADEESGGNGDMEDDENEDGDGEEEDEEETDEDDIESGYVKKTIMVGTAYQAAIPIGLSQYGDILPYENEDKLVWEPSQVSEREVEDYLMKASEIKPTISESNQADENVERTTTVKEGTSTSTSTPSERLPRPNAQKEAAPRNETTQDTRDTQSVTSSIDGDGAVIKDNEQALHLLVQCGYDFKEALRRKRLNAVPLTGSMSLWSDDECSKFEEGIQKFGKDFLKIRQNQVRTRTMRELVQFYYLWKKSERRDQNFANSNTVDHMDIYLDEGSEYGSNAASQPATANLILNTRKSTSMQNNFSILTGSNASLTTNNAPSQTSATVSALISNNRRRSTTGGTTTTAASGSGSNDNQNPTSNSNNNRNDVNIICATGKQT